MILKLYSANKSLSLFIPSGPMILLLLYYNILLLLYYKRLWFPYVSPGVTTFTNCNNYKTTNNNNNYDDGDVAGNRIRLSHRDCGYVTIFPFSFSILLYLKSYVYYMMVIHSCIIFFFFYNVFYAMFFFFF